MSVSRDGPIGNNNPFYCQRARNSQWSIDRIESKVETKMTTLASLRISADHYSLAGAKWVWQALNSVGDLKTASSSRPTSTYMKILVSRCWNHGKCWKVWQTWKFTAS